jgi:hypothetical protein
MHLTTSVYGNNINFYKINVSLIIKMLDIISRLQVTVGIKNYLRVTEYFVAPQGKQL